MAETLALAVGVPAVLAAACLASRRSWSPAHADNRGIALQTVIVIVVMLVIAGGVAGVLLSRGAEVQADLEAQQLSGFQNQVTTENQCNSLTSVGSVATTVWTAGNAAPCVATALADTDTALQAHTAFEAWCGRITGGTHARNGANPDTCTITA